MPQIGAFTFNPENGDILDAQGQPVTQLKWSDMGEQRLENIPLLLVEMIETFQKNTSVTEICGDETSLMVGFDAGHLSSILAACKRLKSFEWGFEYDVAGHVRAYEAICATLKAHPGIQSVKIMTNFDHDGLSDELQIRHLLEMLENSNIKILDVGHKRLNEDDLIALLDVINQPDCGLKEFRREEFDHTRYIGEDGPHRDDVDKIAFVDDPGILMTDKMVPHLEALCRNLRVVRFDLAGVFNWTEACFKRLNDAFQARMLRSPLRLSVRDSFNLIPGVGTLQDMQFHQLGVVLQKCIKNAMEMVEGDGPALASSLLMAVANGVRLETGGVSDDQEDEEDGDLSELVAGEAEASQRSEEEALFSETEKGESEDNAASSSDEDEDEDEDEDDFESEIESLGIPWHQLPSHIGKVNRHYLMAIASNCNTHAGLVACIQHMRAMFQHESAGLAYCEHIPYLLEKIFFALWNHEKNLDALAFASAMDPSDVGPLPIVGALIKCVGPELCTDVLEFNQWLDSMNDEGNPNLDTLSQAMLDIAQRQLELGMHADWHLRAFRPLNIVLDGIRCVTVQEQSIGKPASVSSSRYQLFSRAGDAPRLAKRLRTDDAGAAAAARPVGMA